MQYISTRGEAQPATFKEVLLAGLAPDGGLYVPEAYPKVSLEDLKDLHKDPKADYVRVARAILPLFMDDIPLEDLNRLIEVTYTTETFGVGITPLKWLAGDLALLQLSNGPTLAFKDVGMQFLGNLFEYVLGASGATLNILGATSGDTGSAAEHAMRGKKGIRVFMLSPQGRMSAFQAAQMYSLQDANIFNIAVNGVFDDCQDIVKAVSGDASFKQKNQIGAVNSINWARIAAQVVYYFYAYLQAVKNVGDEVTFAIPSGNFGNGLAAHVARKMGLPIKILVATNENDVLDVFFRTGDYRVRKEVKATSSPSMDISKASNFERLVFDLVGRDASVVRRLWDSLEKDGYFDALFLSSELRSSGISSGRASEAEVLATIRRVHDKTVDQAIIDPHTAVAMKVGLEQRALRYSLLVVAETAQAAKFPDVIRAALGFEPRIPRGFEALADRPQRKVEMEPDAEMVKKYIAAHTN